ncbi:hypothetical protein KP509_1Z203700 [Ceratopteris richardii]|nr:hypothetical protein KP509_1Z203700 [Ceratopteris richardii]
MLTMAMPALRFGSRAGIFVAAMAILLVLIAFVRWFWSHYRPTERLPPGSMGWPLVGETMDFLQPHSATSRGRFMEKHIKRYGNVFKSSLFGHQTIISADPELNKFILVNENKLFQCSYPSTITGILGKWSMLVLVGEEHKRMRSIAINFMNPAKLKDFFFKDIERHVLLTLQSWKDGDVLFAQQEAKKFTFNLMAKQILTFNPEEPRTQELMKDYYTFMKGVIAAPLNIPGTAYYRALKSRSKILDTLGRIMDARSQKPEDKYNDLLEVVTKSGSLTTEQVLDLVLNMLFAGHETSSVALTLALKFLADAPAVVQQLQEEHQAIYAARSFEKERLTWEDYKKMNFTHCVINETLRLGNVVRFVHRKALKDVYFKDFFIPKGWKVLPVFCAAHLDAGVYCRPLEFDPWRWQQIQEKNVYFTPFGGGNRLCAGADLAKLEMAVFIHHLVLQFEWKIAEADRAMAFPFVEFEKGLPIQINRRCFRPMQKQQ